LPRAIGTSEHNAVTLAQKHLGRAARVIVGIVGHVLVDEANVAHAGANAGEFPGRRRLGFVVEARGKIPGHSCAVLQTANGITGLILESHWRERRLPQYLRWQQIKKISLHLPMEIWRVVEDDLGGMVDEVAKQR